MQQTTLGNPLAERLVLAFLLTCLTLLAVQQDWLWRLDRVIYDSQLRIWTRSAPDEIIIIAIDEESLEHIGRWPWPRSMHAQLLERLAPEKPRAIAFDILLSEPDLQQPENDARFAAALARNHNVFLPVAIEQTRRRGFFSESLPIPELTIAATGLGHIHVELDKDGMARHTYLNEGLGTARWENINLALLRAGESDLPGATNDYRTYSPGSESISADWVRNTPVMIPYAGPPGHFRRISFHQVISGDFAPGTFHDKYVLVGATAVGLGDALPTPVSGNNEPMSGVEINANILDALYRGIDLKPVELNWLLVFSGFFALLPFLLFHLFLPRTNLLITVALILACLLVSSALLVFKHLWLPPTAAIIAIMLSFPLWNSRRLGRTMVLLGQELKRFEEQEANLRSQELTPVDSALEFVTSIFALKGWCITDTQGAVLKSYGNCPIPSGVHLIHGRWTRHGDILVAQTRIESMDATIYLHLRSSEPPSVKEQEILDKLLLHYTERRHPETRGRAEIVLARVEQVQNAATQLRAVYRFIENSLSQMADGILVTDRFGHVILSNRQAVNLLALPETEELKGRLITDLLAPLTHQENTSWNALIKRVLVENRSEVTSVRQGTDRDLMVQINPLAGEDDTPGGIIITLSDISKLKNSERRRNEALSFLSHDLRSPMVSLLALLELAKAKDPSGELQELITRMETYTGRTIQLSEQFLHLAKAESEEDLEFYDVNLVDIIANAVEEVWATASAHKISITQDIEPEDARIAGDAGLLERAFINLLTNAVKYSPEDRTITVHLSRMENDYRCCVDDQGYGVPEDELPALFNQFKRGTSPAHHMQKGAGLGLALVKAVAERHHGRVEVTSTAGAGSCFCMILPAADAG